MDNYLVSARKYRPSTFSNVVGQRALTTTLKNAIASGKLAHAYLFCGPRGVGKTTCARIFAKTINCLSPTPDGEACNACEACIAMNEQRSLNVHELDAASNNSVEDIRSLIEQVRIPPQIGRYKVYIIDEVHMLSTSAFNAFLKTLEEPPHYAVFVLATTEKHKVLPTILSRCQIYDFSRITLADTISHLKEVAQSEGIVAEEEALAIIAQKADGGMRDALSIFDQVSSFTQGNITYKKTLENLHVLDVDYFFRLTEATLHADVTSCWLILDEVLRSGFDAQQFLSGLALHFRNLLLCKNPQTASMLEMGETTRQLYLGKASMYPTKLLYNALTLTNECDMAYRTSRNKRLLIELLLVRLCHLNSDKTIADNELGSSEKKKQLPTITPKTASVVIGKASHKEPSTSTSTPVPVVVPTPPPPQQEVLLPRKEEEPKHTKEPVSSRHKNFKNLGVSLSQIGQPQKRLQDESTTPEQQEQHPFSQQELTLQWNTFADTQIPKHQMWLKQTMQHTTPILLENNVFEVVVNNPGQQEHLQEHATDITRFLRSTLKNSFISMQIRVSENNERKLAFTAQEKFKLMVEENHHLEALQAKFLLELE